MKFVLLDMCEDLKLDVAISILQQEKVPYNIKKKEKDMGNFLFNTLSNYTPIECNIEISCSLEKFEFIKHLINQEYSKMKYLENCYKKEASREVFINKKNTSGGIFKKAHKNNTRRMFIDEVPYSYYWDFPHFDL